MNANGLLTSFDFPDVNRVKVSFFSQLFLGKTRSLTVLADGFPDKPSLSRRCRHATTGKQEAAPINTVYNPLFLLLRVLGLNS
jgi:hypothetical protein